MKQAMVSIPDDLAKAVDGYVQAQDAPPPLTAVVQAALRQCLPAPPCRPDGNIAPQGVT